MSNPDLSSLAWRKSSHSGGGNDCVEIAFTGGAVAVRDSKRPAAGALLLDADRWRGIREAARVGGLDIR